MGEFISSRKQILKDISKTNTIAQTLTKNLQGLHDLAEVHLSTELLPAIEVLYQRGLMDKHIEDLQRIFQDLYYLIGADKRSMTLHVNYRKVMPIIRRWEHMAQPVEEHLLDRDYRFVSSSLSNLISYYIILLLYYKKSNALIVGTVNYNSQLTYWLALEKSDISKMLYFLQTLPVKILRLGQLIIKSFRDRFQTSMSSNWVSQSHLLWSSFMSTSLSLMDTVPSFSIYRLNTGVLGKMRLLYRTPIDIISKEVARKTEMLRNKIDNNCEQLGVILSALPNPEKISTISDLKDVPLYQDLKIFGADLDFKSLSRSICEIFEVKEIFEDTVPSFLARYWLVLLLTIYYGPSGTINVYKNRYEILHWIKFNFIDTVVGFGKNWVIKPISNMLSILRNDESLQQVGLISKDSLQSDLDSLERMVLDYLADYKNEESQVLTQEIHEAIRQGNLTLLMSNYEQDLRQPFKSLIKGSLLRAILIQIQKAKVDGAVMVSGIDKMLKSQQLLFGAVSLSPSLFILYRAYHFLVDKSSRPLIINGKQANIVCIKSMNNIERLISREQSNLNSGKLFFEIVNLQLHSFLLVPRQIKDDWIADLDELNSVYIKPAQKHEILTRIWNTYSYYFR